MSLAEYKEQFSATYAQKPADCASIGANIAEVQPDGTVRIQLLSADIAHLEALREWISALL